MKFEDLIKQQSKKELEYKITIWYVKLLFPIVGMSIFLIHQYYANISFCESIKNNTSFTCKSRDSDPIVVKIDLKDGWRLEEDYFVKSGSKINIERCEVDKKEGKDAE